MSAGKYSGRAGKRRTRLPPETFETIGPIYESIIEVKSYAARVLGKRAAAIHAAQKEVLRAAMVILECDENDPTTSFERNSPYASFHNACVKLREAARSKQ